MSVENEGAIANVGFVVGGNAVAVIDTGGSVREGRRFRAAVRQVTDKPIRYVINTHAHPDHVFGNAAFEAPDDGSETLFTGDLLFMQHVPVLDGSIRGWLKTIDELASLPAANVIPGHGLATEWPGALSGERTYLKRLASDCRDLIKRGVPLAEAAQIAAISER